MGVRAAVVAALSVATIASAAGASAAGGSGSASLSIPLPAVNSVMVSQLTVHVTAPAGKRVGKLKIIATNAAQLGSAKGNTQVVAAMSPASAPKQSATFKVWVFIHRFAPVRRSLFAAQDATADLRLVDAGDEVKITVWVHSQSCSDLENERGYAPGNSATTYFNFQDDSWETGVGSVELDNLVLAFDTDSEAQMDNAVFNKCPGAENPASDPPPN